MVRRRLSDDAGGRFAIDAATGAVTVADGARLDREAAASHEIVVVATSSDGSLEEGRFTIAVAAVPNAAPEAADDAHTVGEGATLTVAQAGGLLINDSDGDGDPLTARLLDGPDHGTLTLSADGSFVYTPDAGFSGEDGFTYEAFDGQDASAPATATITVEPAATDRIAGVDGVVLLLESGRGVSEAGGVVAEWADQSGQGNHVTGAGGPMIGLETTPTGRAAISFDGDDDKLQRLSGLSGLPGGGDDRTMFLVIDHEANYSGGSLKPFAGAAYGKSGNGRAFGLVLDASDNLTVQGWGFVNDHRSSTNGLGANDGGSGPDWFVQSAVLESGLLSQYLDGAALFEDRATSFDTDVRRLMLGAEIGGSTYREMDIAAVVVFDRALSEAEHLQVSTHLRDTYIAARPKTEQGNVVLALNAGGDGQRHDGVTYANDVGFVSGPSRIFGERAGDPYASERFGPEGNGGDLRYDIPIENGTYAITLQFAEIFFNAEGERVFDVRLEDQLVIDDLDLFAEVGANTPFERTFEVSVEDGQIDLDLIASVNNAKISGIVVRELAPIDVADTMTDTVMIDEFALF